MKNIKTLFCLLLIAHPLAAAGEGGEEGTRVQIPRYTELQRGQTSYVGTVTENGKQFRIKDISFTGETILHGLQSEISDSRIALDLGDVLAIEVIESVYRSEKFDQEFIKTRVIPKKKTAAGSMFPRRFFFRVMCNSRQLICKQILTMPGGYGMCRR